MGRNVKWNKRIEFKVPAQKAALQALGELAADMLETRINRDGKDAGGKPLPQVGTGNERGKGWFATSKNDPRKLIANGEPRNVPGSKGDPSQVVDRGGYRSVKARLGKKTTKGSSLTGAMWRSLTITNKAEKGRSVLRLYFGGSQRVGAGRFKNRDKARLLQFATRAEGQGLEPSGTKQFTLMEFSASEKKALVKFWLRQIRLFRRA